MNQEPENLCPDCKLPFPEWEDNTYCNKCWNDRQVESKIEELSEPFEPAENYSQGFFSKKKK